MGQFLSSPFPRRGFSDKGFFGPVSVPAIVPPPQMIAIITPGANSNGPFDSPPNPSNQSAPAYSNIAHSAGLINPDPFLINGSQLMVWGDVQDTSIGTVDWLVVAITGAGLPQNFFNSLSFVDSNSVAYTLDTSATQAFNTHYQDPTLTIWEWQPSSFPTLFSFEHYTVTFT